MKIKRIGLASSSLITSITIPLVLVSCSSSVDQKFVDNFYLNITSKTDWVGNTNEYASSIYDLKTFRSVFRDQLPTNDELLAKGFTLSLENIISYDQFGTSNYTIYLRDSKNGKTYLPTPVKISEENDKKESVVSFSIEGFLKTTDLIDEEFQNAYDLVPEKYSLNSFGQNFFQNQNIESNISFDNPDSPYYVGKLFDYQAIPNFELASFQEVSIDDKNKTTTFRLYLKKDKKTKGPGKLVTLSL